MKFTEFRGVIDKIIELQIEVENIKKEEYEKLSRREQINYNISATFNKIENSQNLEEKFFPKDVYKIISAKQKEITSLKNNLTNSLGDWEKFFWVDINEFNNLLNEYVQAKNIDGSFILNLDRQNEHNFITGETKVRGLLKITYSGEKETTYTIKIENAEYDFPEIKNLIMKSVSRNEMETNNIKISPDILCTTSWQEFEQGLSPIEIRDIYWKALKHSIEMLKYKKEELLTSTVSKNIAKIYKLNEEIDNLKKNSQACIGKRTEIYNNSNLDTYI